MRDERHCADKEVTKEMGSQPQGRSLEAESADKIESLSLVPFVNLTLSCVTRLASNFVFSV